MIKVSTTASALAGKIAETHLERNDQDLFYQAVVDFMRAVENILQDKGIVFPDGSIQPSGLVNRAPNINTIKRGVRDHVAVDDLVATFWSL